MSLSKHYSNCKKRTIESEHSVFQERWELAYFCCESRGKITCLICSQSISVVKEYNIRHHYETHSHKYDQHQDKPREDKVRDLKTALGKQQPLFKNSKGDGEASVRVSYVIAELIAKNCKCYSDSEFSQTFPCREIQLQRERVDDIARNLNEQLLIKAESFVPFSIAVDESTDISGKAQLLGIVSLQNTTGKDIFEEVYCFLERFNLPLSKLVCVPTDGAPSMMGKCNGFVTRLLAKQKEVSPESKLHHIHCIIHQDVLCSKTVQMEHVLKYLKKVVNFIRSWGLNQRQFSGLLSTRSGCFLEMKGGSVEGQLNGGNLIHFPTCQDFRKSHSASDFSQYTFNVNELINEFKSRFEDFKTSENDFSLFSDPFSFDVQKADSNVQMELIDIQCNTVLKKNKFNEVGISKFYSYLPSQCSEMCQLAARILAMF
ncbi:hypothetical protein PR048_004095 [Dryococelus australis]|uniref:General transcription factor II-I repeat domain-containing protein 2 n=1 Tax=Dryococelus australis TaxID=614101 RepID=A0ABQ9I4J6_9NEOP|nr:hypothetical protein PR048_004095 [Dryococelus australis]